MPDRPQPPARPTAKRATTVTRPYGGVKAEARREERRQRLLAAGLEVFGHQGYHHTTVRDVCLAAGLTERYFYESFKSLRLLFDAVHEQLRNELLEVTTPPPSPDGTEPLALGVDAALRQLEASLRLWYRFLQADPRRARIMLFDASVIDDLDAVRPNRAAQEFQAGLMRLVDTLHPDLARHGIQLELTVAALTGALTSHARTWAASHYVTPLEDLVRHSMLVFYGLATLYQALNEGKLVMPSADPSLSADASAASRHPEAA
jgi:AcrR family transcriptional regulator